MSIPSGHASPHRAAPPVEPQQYAPGVPSSNMGDNPRHRYNELNAMDVSGTIKVTEVAPVANEVCRLLREVHPQAPLEALAQAFMDLERLFDGNLNGYCACDTLYHDRQHTLDVALAMARLINARERVTPTAAQLGARRSELGVIAALFHDSGYIRKTGDRRHRNGAEYTRVHVSRSAQFLQRYLPLVGFENHAADTARIVHFTGYEIPLDQIKAPDPALRQVGHLLGTADLMAQMADRCYLEKCRDRLYPEFVIGGVAQQRSPDGKGFLYASPEDLLRKTPQFAQGEFKRRLDGHFGRVHESIRELFDGKHPYQDAIVSHVKHADTMAKSDDFRALRRHAPATDGEQFMPTLANYLPEDYPRGHSAAG